MSERKMRRREMTLWQLQQNPTVTMRRPVRAAAQAASNQIALVMKQAKYADSMRKVPRTSLHQFGQFYMQPTVASKSTITTRSYTSDTKKLVRQTYSRQDEDEWRMGGDKDITSTSPKARRQAQKNIRESIPSTMVSHCSLDDQLKSSMDKYIDELLGMDDLISPTATPTLASSSFHSGEDEEDEITLDDSSVSSIQLFASSDHYVHNHLSSQSSCATINATPLPEEDDHNQDETMAVDASVLQGHSMSVAMAHFWPRLHLSCLPSPTSVQITATNGTQTEEGTRPSGNYSHTKQNKIRSNASWPPPTRFVSPPPLLDWFVDDDNLNNETDAHRQLDLTRWCTDINMLPVSRPIPFPLKPVHSQDPRYAQLKRTQFEEARYNNPNLLQWRPESKTPIRSTLQSPSPPSLAQLNLPSFYAHRHHHHPSHQQITPISCAVSSLPDSFNFKMPVVLSPD